MEVGSWKNASNNFKLYQTISNIKLETLDFKQKK